MLSLFLGAGFSKWAVNLPLAAELFDYNIKPFGIHEGKKFLIIKSLKNNWDRINPNGLTEQFIFDALHYPLKVRKVVLWYIVRRLSEPFIWEEFHAQRWRRHTLMIDENRKFSIQGVKEARNFILQCMGIGLKGIITTNYDMLVEYSLGTKLFNYGIMNQVLTGRGPYPVSSLNNPVTLKGNIPISKIHGSVSWDEGAYYTNGRRGLTGNALIVPPTPEKEPPEVLNEEWNLAERILGNSKKCIVFGFAFNPYDEAVIKLMKKAGEDIDRVLLIDINPQVEKAHIIWPRAKIDISKPPPEGIDVIKKWLVYS